MNKNAYILTEKGKVYNEEGLQFLLDGIRNNRSDYADITFCQGQLYNNPQYLAKDLKNNLNAYVFISHAKGIEMLYNDNIQTLITNLESNPNMTSWEIAMAPNKKKKS